MTSGMCMYVSTTPRHVHVYAHGPNRAEQAHRHTPPQLGTQLVTQLVSCWSHSWIHCTGTTTTTTQANSWSCTTHGRPDGVWQRTQLDHHSPMVHAARPPPVPPPQCARGTPSPPQLPAPQHSTAPPAHRARARLSHRRGARSWPGGCGCRTDRRSG